MIPEEWAGAMLRIRKLSLEEVKTLLKIHEFESAVGHQSTADFLTALLGIPIKADRRPVTFQPGTLYVVFQLLGRLPEGRILTEEELQTINYRFYSVEVNTRFDCYEKISSPERQFER
jgi:CYTH domain-containing protein